MMSLNSKPSPNMMLSIYWMITFGVFSDIKATIPYFRIHSHTGIFFFFFFFSIWSGYKYFGGRDVDSGWVVSWSERLHIVID